VDGGSKDGTCEIIKRYSERISMFVSESDKGIYDAMNKGIRLAHGQWLLFMNSGDLFHNTDFFSRIFCTDEILDQYAIIYGNTLVKHTDTILEIPYKKITPNFFFLNTICHQSVFFNKTVFEKIGNYRLDYRIISDRVLLYQIALSKGKFRKVEDIISIWDEEGFSKTNFSLFLEEDKRFTRANFNLWTKLVLKVELKVKRGFRKIKRCI
jgi:glycosyltransferase involved in cell wall biosynthesis